MPKGEKFQGVEPKEDDAENPIWQRSARSSPRTLNRQGKP